MKQQQEQIQEIKVTKKISCLIITMDNKRNMFKTQKTIMIDKAIKLANMTHSVKEKCGLTSCIVWHKCNQSNRNGDK